MEIVGIPEPEKEAIYDEFLAYISIYDDVSRTKRFKNLLWKLRKHIKNRVCVEAGAGFGIFAEYMLKLGAEKVYCVESNPLMCMYLKEKFKKEKRVTIVEDYIQNFTPPEEVDFLLHEFFGSLLYDENLKDLENLKFTPKILAPDTGLLMYTVVDSKKYKDRVVDERVLQILKGSMISDLFLKKLKKKWNGVAARWKWPEGLECYQVDISNEKGDLIALGIEIYHQKTRIIGTTDSLNWSTIWMIRKSDKFKIEFKENEPELKWL